MMQARRRSRGRHESGVAIDQRVSTVQCWVGIGCGQTRSNCERQVVQYVVLKGANDDLNRCSTKEKPGWQVAALRKWASAVRVD